jgi:hypothetical protein
LATVVATRVRSFALSAASSSAASVLRRVAVVRTAAADSASSVRWLVARALSSQDVQQAAVAKQASRTWSATSTGLAYVTSAGVHRVVLSASSAQVATVGRVVTAIRLSVGVNVALRRRDLARVVRADQDNVAVLVLVPIRPNFIQPRGGLLVSGGDLALATRGLDQELISSGEGGLLSSGGRASTLTSTGT